jgi:hypothetical protein
MVDTVSIHEAKTHLSRLLDALGRAAALHGQDFLRTDIRVALE